MVIETVESWALATAWKLVIRMSGCALFTWTKRPARDNSRVSALLWKQLKLSHKIVWGCECCAVGIQHDTDVRTCLTLSLSDECFHSKHSGWCVHNGSPPYMSPARCFWIAVESDQTQTPCNKHDRAERDGCNDLGAISNLMLAYIAKAMVVNHFHLIHSRTDYIVVIYYANSNWTKNNWSSLFWPKKTSNQTCSLQSTADQHGSIPCDEANCRSSLWRRGRRLAWPWQEPHLTNQANKG